MPLPSNTLPLPTPLVLPPDSAAMVRLLLLRSSQAVSQPAMVTAELAGMAELLSMRSAPPINVGPAYVLAPDRTSEPCFSQMPPVPLMLDGKS